MKRILLGMLLLLTLSIANGCAMCCTPYDDDYSAFGGSWQRTDMRNGRVGSAYDAAATMSYSNHAPPAEVIHSPHGREYIHPGQ